MKLVFKYAIGIVLLCLTFTVQSKAQNCNSSDIQAKLDSGKSLYTVIQECPSNATNDFTGKNYAGGVIVYVDESKNGKGIVAATEDENSNAYWYNRLSSNGISYNSSLIAPIGSGANNMNAACAISGCGKPPKTIWPNYNSPALDALYFVASTNRGGYTDWYLPSSEEIKVAYQNVPSNFANCPSGGWWSSTQIPPNYAFQGLTSYQVKEMYTSSVYVLNNNGTLSYAQKSNGRCARAFRSFAPWIDSDNTTEVEAGSAMTIEGSNFDPIPANNTIFFPNGITTHPHESTSSIMTVIVPPGAHDGEIRVVVDGIQSNAVEFEIGEQPIGNPVINSFSEKVLIVGDNFQSDRVMTVYGENFSLTNTVTFAGGAIETSAPSSNQNQFNVTIPLNALTGPITVTSSVGHSNPSSDSLIVLEYSMPTLGTTTQDLHDVAIDSTGTYVVAVGNENNVVISENDGTDWSFASLGNPPISNLNINTVVYSDRGGASVFTLWGSVNTINGSTYYQMYNSAESISNLNPKVSPDDISNLFASNGQIFGIKNYSSLVYNSGFSNSNIYQWTDIVGNSSEIMDFASSGEKIISVGMGTSAYWTSTPSNSTSSWTSNTQNFWLNSVIWAENQFVGVGKEPSSLRNQPSVYYSSDGSNWTAGSCDGAFCGYPQLGVAYNSDLNLYFSGGHVLKHYYSTDGQNWSTINLPSNFGTHITQINKIVPSDDGFIFVGNGGLIGVLKAKRPAH
ncbi:MAG: IPT/TIG domain-containing protein [Balneolaceae bacterium]